MKALFALLSLLFCTVITNAQKTTIFNSSNSNLPNYGFNDAQDLLVDIKGNVWINIRGYGIYKYDGQEFKHIDTLDKYTNPLFTDKEGRVWFGSGNTIMMFDGNNWIKYIKEQTKIENRIFTISEAPSGKLYIGTGDGLYTFDGSHWEQVTYPMAICMYMRSRALNLAPQVKFFSEAVKACSYLMAKSGLP